jgi:hypothetical protein
LCLSGIVDQLLQLSFSLPDFSSDQDDKLG